MAIFRPGACDVKAGMSAMLTALVFHLLDFLVYMAAGGRRTLRENRVFGQLPSEKQKPKIHIKGALVLHLLGFLVDPETGGNRKILEKQAVRQRVCDHQTAKI